MAKLCRGDYLSMKVETLCRVAGTLGIAPAEPVPALARRLFPPTVATGRELQGKRAVRFVPTRIISSLRTSLGPISEWGHTEALPTQVRGGAAERGSWRAY